MADIARWDPFNELASMRRTMDRLLGDVTPWRSGDGETLTMPVDVYDTEDEVVVKASLPGVQPDDIDISVTGQLVTIKGRTQQEHEERAENFYRHERRHGAFIRQIELPSEVKSDEAEATYENGVLQLKLPKAEEMRPKSIRVQARAGGEQPQVGEGEQRKNGG
jgi:HSP20 family protein